MSSTSLSTELQGHCITREIWIHTVHQSSSSSLFQPYSSISRPPEFSLVSVKLWSCISPNSSMVSPRSVRLSRRLLKVSFDRNMFDMSRCNVVLTNISPSLSCSRIWVCVCDRFLSMEWSWCPWYLSDDVCVSISVLVEFTVPPDVRSLQISPTMVLTRFNYWSIEFPLSSSEGVASCQTTHWWSEMRRRNTHSFTFSSIKPHVILICTETHLSD
jgi:hypothetical protein